MPKDLFCPSCGNRGQATTDEAGAFEIRGQFEGKAIRKCNRCGAGLAIGPFSGGFFGEPQLIPKDIWKRMEEIWAQRFGAL
jgi:hypothetical protein